MKKRMSGIVDWIVGEPGQIIARYGLMPVGLAVVGGVGAYLGQDMLDQHRWVAPVMGLLAGFGLGMLIAFR